MWKYSIVNNTWAWLSGRSGAVSWDYNVGTIGEASLTATPSVRSGGCGAVDPVTRKLYYFGGVDDRYHYNEIHSFDMVSEMWTLLGPDSLNSFGTYGGSDTFGPNWKPRSRESCSAFFYGGFFWMFGGYGPQRQYSTGSPGVEGVSNDLWRYDPTLNQWAWVGGSNDVDSAAAGNYADLNQYSANNWPPGRWYLQADWDSSRNKFVLWGGRGRSGSYTDIWEFDPVIKQWNWVAGPNFAGEAQVKVTQGIPNPATRPSPIAGGTMWLDTKNRDIYVYGGFRGGDPEGCIFSFNLDSRVWTWHGDGFLTFNAQQQGIMSASFHPGQRSYLSLASDQSSRETWLFGGFVNAAQVGQITRRGDLFYRTPSFECEDASFGVRNLF
jgi:hypothetical protein